MTEYFERYLVVDCSPRGGIMLRIDQWPEPLPIPAKGKGVLGVLTKEETEEIVPRSQIDDAFSRKRASYIIAYPDASTRGEDAKLHLDVEIKGEHRVRVLDLI